jgi:hypothetical protein
MSPPHAAGSPTAHAPTGLIEGCLLLGRGEGPGGARAALLAEVEAQLLRRRQPSLVGPEGRTGLGKLERAEQVAAKVTLLT